MKRSSSFAPAFTSLGIYYADYVSPPDLDRSSKCFQKAFEIDAGEGEAARRLADGFANEREWDLVEVVARRTIEGEGGLEGGMTGTDNAVSKYMPTNAWAWKALGVVELVIINIPLFRVSRLTRVSIRIINVISRRLKLSKLHYELIMMTLPHGNDWARHISSPGDMQQPPKLCKKP